MNQPKVSVIIPVYNTEKNLRECLDSVVNQTLKDIEIICVDDGSTDGSPGILKEYQMKDSRVVVITQANCGAGVARNNAIAAAQGEYIAFLDADDIMTEDALEAFYSAAIRTDADVVLSKVAIFFSDPKKSHETSFGLNEEYIPSKDTFSAKEIYQFVFNFTTGAPGGKCFKRSFIKENKLEFLKIRKSEDFYFIHLGIAKADRITVIRRSLYLKRSIPTSLEHQKDNMPLLFWDAVELLKVRLEEEGLFECVKQSFLNAGVDRFVYNLTTMKSEEGVKAVLEKLRQVGEIELGLGLLPERYYYEKDKYLYLCRQLGIIPVPVDSHEEKHAGKTGKAGSFRTFRSSQNERAMTFVSRKVRGGIQCYREHGARYTLRRTLYHMGLWEDEEAPKGSENRPKLISGAERFIKGKREKKKG